MIKKLYFAAIAAAFVFTGCAEGQADLPQVGNSEGLVELTVSVSDAQTKTTGQNYLDKIINDIQIFVFNKYGVYETSATAENYTLKLSCTSGHKQIVALVNADPVSDVLNISDLGAIKSDLASVGNGELVMVGTKEVDLPCEGPVVIDVTRLVGRVVLKSVYLDFALPQHQRLSFEITDVYVVNAAGDRAYLEENEPSFWYNEGACDPAATLPHLYDAVVDGSLVSRGPKYETNHYFYCYPNNTEKKTRLVVEALRGGNPYYYPITLDEIRSNHAYAYDLTITRLGSDSPNVPVDESVVTYTAVTGEWIQHQEQEEI